MAILDIVTLPEPILRRKARKVSVFDKDLQALLDNMVETMRVAPGVGLAAPQVNVPLRAIVVEYGEDEDEAEEAPKKLYLMLNPEIVQASDETETAVEACLSIPSLVGEVERFSQIVIKGQNRKGKPMKVKASGWMARIFQHEIDHLDGVLFTDRATRVWKPKEDEAALVKD